MEATKGEIAKGYMCGTCDMVPHMSKMIQIRNVPESLHRAVKARAARAGMSLSDYLLREVERTMATPTVEEVIARVASRSRPTVSESPADAVRAERLDT